MFSKSLAPFDLLRFATTNVEGNVPVQQNQQPNQPAQRTAEDYKKDPVVLGIMNDVRKEEKDKLYSELQSVKQSLSSLQADAQAREQAIKDANAKAEAERIASLSWQDQLAYTKAQTEQVVAQARQEVAAELDTLRKEAAKNRLSAFTANQINEQGIPAKYASFIRGDSEEEIKNSLLLVKTIIEDTKAAAQQVTPGQQTVLPAGTQFPPANAGIVNPAAQPTDFSNPNVPFQLDEQRYMNDPAYREEVKAGAKKQYIIANS